jgi:hypothetical protein
MKVADVIFTRGTKINKLDVWECEEAFENLGINIYDIIDTCCSEDSDFIYISSGFLHMLEMEEKVDGEYHHYFIKQEDGSFECETYKF